MGNINTSSGPELLKYPKLRFWFLKILGEGDWVENTKKEIDYINRVRIKDYERKNKKPPAPPSRFSKTIDDYVADARAKLNKRKKFTLADFEEHTKVIIDVEDEGDHIHLKTHFGNNYTFDVKDIKQLGGLVGIVRHVVVIEKQKEMERKAEKIQNDFEKASEYNPVYAHYKKDMKTLAERYHEIHEMMRDVWLNK